MIRELMHRRYERELERLFVRGLSPARHLRLRAHIKGCTDCREHYEGVRRLEDALFRTADGAPSAMERLAELVVRNAEPSAPVTHGGRRLLWSLVAAAATVFAIVSIVRLAPKEELTARGVATAPQPAALSVFIVDPAKNQVSLLPRAATATPVKRGSVLQLAYSNSHFSHLAVVGFDAELSLHWYYSTDSAANRSLQKDVTEEPMGRAFEVVAAPGLVRLFAVFDDKPIAQEQVERVFHDLGRSGLGPIGPTEILGLGASVDTVLLDVQP
jgi:hypothetical protein